MSVRGLPAPSFPHGGLPPPADVSCSAPLTGSRAHTREQFCESYMEADVGDMVQTAGALVAPENMYALSDVVRHFECKRIRRQ